MWTIIWNSIALTSVGVVLLRLAGRKSISQMTTPQLAILLSIGSILGSEVGGKGLLLTIVATTTFMAFLVAIEWLSLKSNFADVLLKGKSVIVITNGTIHLENMKRLRLTEADLVKRLRMVGISRYQEVLRGTIEANGELGYELMPHAKPMTLGDFEKIMLSYFPQLTVKSPSTHDSHLLVAEERHH